MRKVGSSCLTDEVLHAMGGNDPVCSRVGREGFDVPTVAHLSDIFSHPSVRSYFGGLAKATLQEEELVSAMRNVATRTSAAGLPDPPDLAAFVALVVERKDPGAALAKAYAGLLALAFLEGLARIHRPSVAYPYFSLNAIDSICMPVARLLMDADLLGGAAMLAMELRSYIMIDPYQRKNERGQRLTEDCRAIERAYLARRHAACKEAAWALQDKVKSDVMVRAGLASVFFTLGDSMRAQAVATGRHVPSLGVLVDLAEISIELAPVDPLLQAVWLAVLPEEAIELPEEMRLPIRMSRRDVNSQFKGVDAAFGETGLSLTAAYARVLFGYVTGLLEKAGYEGDAWKVLIKSLELPTWWMNYRSGLLRVLELYSLANPPGVALAPTEMISAFSGREARVANDLRMAAIQSLEMDNWSTQRGQVGRSLAYDNAFLTEPWRREESAVTTINILEAHRYAAMEYWLTVIPPLLPLPKRRREQKVVEQDLELMDEYRSLAFAAEVNEAPLHLRVYGMPKARRFIEVNEGERSMQLNHWSEKHQTWYEKAIKDFPVYTALRVERECTVEWVQSYLRTGISW
jgi:hypothetical protein